MRHCCCQSGQLVRFLGEWTTAAATLDSAMWSLAKGLYQHCYWGHRDLQLVEAWLHDLHTIGYQ